MAEGYQDEFVSLAEFMRPKDLESYVGQRHLLDPSDGLISGYLKTGYLVSMVLYGPPGIGKTSLAQILASEAGYVYIELSATDLSIAELKQLLAAILDENTKRMHHKVNPLRVVIFIDEIHRFNITQQDFLLPLVEAGSFVFIGATTMEPTKRLRPAILSRCQIFQLRRHSVQDLEVMIRRAMLHENIRRKVIYKKPFLSLNEDITLQVARLSSGDARVAITFIETISSQITDPTAESTEDIIGRTMKLFTKSELPVSTSDCDFFMNRLIEIISLNQREIKSTDVDFTDIVSGEQHKKWLAHIPHSDDGNPEVEADKVSFSLLVDAARVCLVLNLLGMSTNSIQTRLLLHFVNEVDGTTSDLPKLIAAVKAPMESATDENVALIEFISYLSQLPLKRREEAMIDIKLIYEYFERHPQADTVVADDFKVQYDDKKVQELLSQPEALLLKIIPRSRTIEVVQEEELSLDFSTGI